jgi:hypothetical protein
VIERMSCKKFYYQREKFSIPFFAAEGIPCDIEKGKKKKLEKGSFNVVNIFLCVSP